MVQVAGEYRDKKKRGAIEMRIESKVSYSLVRALAAILEAIGKDIEEPQHASWHANISSLEVDQIQLEMEIHKWGQGIEPVEVVCDIDVYFDDCYNQDEENLTYEYDHWAGQKFVVALAFVSYQAGFTATATRVAVEGREPERRKGKDTDPIHEVLKDPKWNIAEAK
jgi:hypothetical protein